MFFTLTLACGDVGRDWLSATQKRPVHADTPTTDSQHPGHGSLATLPLVLCHSSWSRRSLSVSPAPTTTSFSLSIWPTWQPLHCTFRIYLGSSSSLAPPYNGPPPPHKDHGPTFWMFLYLPHWGTRFYYMVLSKYTQDKIITVHSQEMTTYRSESRQGFKTGASG